MCSGLAIPEGDAEMDDGVRGALIPPPYSRPGLGTPMVVFSPLPRRAKASEIVATAESRATQTLNTLDLTEKSPLTWPRRASSERT
jgi:hypothetical protein